ncbi:hypothetical protein [Rhodobacter lacus]|uniref:Uncharacterized protein n=1 Tax=Rhodobacter lacus TaxID=1641972 RepID=A0ABW5ADR3_9RHOB
MTLATTLVVTAEPDGSKPRLRFFTSPQAAADHARMICRDLNRDAYVAEVSHRFLASRQSWQAQQEKKA